MKKILLVAAFSIIAFGITGCNKQGTKQAAGGGSDAAYQAALADAKAEQKKAAAVGGEWRDTGKMIKNAEKLAAEGDFAKATSLADKAAAQSRLGREQAASQVNVGNPSYLY